MKQLKMLWIAAIALAASMALASPAFATFATSPAGTVYTGPLAGSSEGLVVWHTSVFKFECTGTMEGFIEAHGPSVTGKGEATNFTYKECNSNVTINTIKKGSLEIHSAGKGVGTITSTGTVGEGVLHAFGIKCIYTTNNTDLGVVTDSSITGGKATLHLNATIPRTGGSAFCGATATLTAAAIVNTPEQIFID